MAGLEFSVVVVYIYFFIFGKSQISPCLTLFTMKDKFLNMVYKAFYNLITCLLLQSHPLSFLLVPCMRTFSSQCGHTSPFRVFADFA